MASYTDLKTQVALWLHRTDLDSQMDNFALLAEDMINRQLRAQVNQTVSAETFNATIFTLPDDYNEMRSLKLEKDKVVIVQVSLNQLEAYRKTSQPFVYAIHSGIVEFSGDIDPANPFSGEIIYYADVPSLTANTTNSVLDKYPLLYQAAMLFHAFGFLQDSEESSKWLRIYDGMIASINKSTSGYVLPRVRSI